MRVSRRPASGGAKHFHDLAVARRGVATPHRQVEQVVVGLIEQLAEALASAAALVSLVLVFLLHHAQLHDTRALHAKLDELILGLEGPRDELAQVERKAVEELEEIASKHE